MAVARTSSPARSPVQSRMLLLVVMSEPSCRHSVETDGERGETVAVADQPEEQAGVCAVHRIGAHFVDQQQRAGHVLAALQPGGWKTGIRAQGGEEFIEPEVRHRDPDLDRPDAEAAKQV